MFNTYTKNGLFNNELIEKLTFAEPKNKSSGDPNKLYYTGDLQIRNSDNNYLKVVPASSEVDSDYEIIWAKLGYINAFTRPLNEGRRFKITLNDFSFGERFSFFWN